MPKDLFSTQAALYAQYRPVYPKELFEYLLTLVKERHRAWDCATGNGQAAIALAPYFDKIYATDISEKQLQQAIQHEKIIYAVTRAEKTSFPDHSFDLITVAQAYHWFHFDAFHLEVLRVAKPGAILAVWGYSLVICDDEKVQSLIDTFYRQTIGPYWDNERKYIDDHFSTVPFPYEELTYRDFKIQVSWNKEALTGYLNTWSAVQHFIKDRQYNPVDEFYKELADAWPDNSTLSFYFPLFLRTGQTSK